MNTLHLLRLPVNLRAFTAWALDRGYLDTPPGDGRGRPRDAEFGYALHAALTGLFGRQAPRPFAVAPLGRRERRRAGAGSDPTGTMELFGYAQTSLETLRTLAELAEDGLWPLIDWDRARSRPMPGRWPMNLRLRFELRACPVRRIMEPFRTTSRTNLPAVTFLKGREVDAYQVAVARAFDSALPQRDRVYIEWLAERLAARPEKAPTVRLLTGSVQVESYRSARLLRRPRGANGRRSPQWLTRPDVRFNGLLDVVDPKAFSALLATGVGRHCGFGFGMLLLRPA